jgi:hypothetical protein
MPDSVPYLLPQHRFPNRLDKLRRAAVEIALSEGEFAPAGERGCAIEALFGGFRIRYFSPFQHRTNWKPADWDNKRVAFCVHRLLILRHGLSLVSVGERPLRLCLNRNTLSLMSRYFLILPSLIGISSCASAGTHSRRERPKARNKCPSRYN